MAQNILLSVVIFLNYVIPIDPMEKAVKSEFNNKLRVLDILHENLKHSSPTAVYIEDMSIKLKLSRAYLKDILLRMHQSGDILCAKDGNYSIITKQGLNHYYLGCSSLAVCPIVKTENKTT